MERVGFDSVSLGVRRLFVMMLSLVLVTGCRSLGPHAAQSGAFGGLAGSLAGAAIGASEGKSAEGALIGGLTGATVGTVAGHAVDRDIERERAEIRQWENQQRQAAVTSDQIIQMVHGGLSSDVIIRQIQSQGVVRRPDINQLILLKQQGVDDRIIQAWQTAPLAGSPEAAVPVAVPMAGPPVFVAPCRPYPGYPPGCFYPRRPRSSFGVAVGF